MNRKKIIETLRPYGNIILFFATMLAANWFWKLTVHGDEDTVNAVVTWLGIDVSALFDWMTYHAANWAYWVVGLFRDTVSMPSKNVIAFMSGTSVAVIWGCSGIKQAFIWTCVMLTARGSWKHKTWFIPMGWILCDLLNIVRIAAIAMITEFHPELFELFHTWIFKYGFYTIMFLIWAVFVICFSKRQRVWIL